MDITQLLFLEGMKDNREYSYGVIPLKRREEGLPSVLMVQHRAGHWGFPKGHMEKGETERQTALREVYEETGLKIELLDGFREEVKYYVRSNVLKTVVFFLAKAISEEVIYILPEIKAHLWLDFSKALDRITFDSQKELLRQGYQYLIHKQSCLVEKY